MGRALINLGVSGKVIGDMDWGWCKQMSDASDVATSGSSMTERGTSGYYILSNPNITEDTDFEIHVEATPSYSVVGIFAIADGDMALNSTVAKQASLTYRAAQVLTGSVLHQRNTGGNVGIPIRAVDETSGTGFTLTDAYIAFYNRNTILGALSVINGDLIIYEPDEFNGLGYDEMITFTAQGIAALDALTPAEITGYYQVQGGSGQIMRGEFRLLNRKDALEPWALDATVAKQTEVVYRAAQVLNGSTIHQRNTGADLTIPLRVVDATGEAFVPTGANVYCYVNGVHHNTFSVSNGALAIVDPNKYNGLGHDVLLRFTSQGKTALDAFTPGEVVCYYYLAGGEHVMDGEFRFINRKELVDDIATSVEAALINETDGQTLLQAIIDKIEAWNPNLDSISTVAIGNAVRDALSDMIGQVLDLHDDAFGRWVLNPTAKTLTLYRVNGSVLKVFDLGSYTANTIPPFVSRTPQ